VPKKRKKSQKNEIKEKKLGNARLKSKITKKKGKESEKEQEKNRWKKREVPKDGSRK